MPLTPKIVGDSVTARQGGVVVWQFDVTDVLDDYYVANGCYFERAGGAGVGAQENLMTISDPVQADTDRLADLTMIIGNLRTTRWVDMTDAELATIADIVTLYQ